MSDRTPDMEHLRSMQAEYNRVRDNRIRPAYGLAGCVWPRRWCLNLVDYYALLWPVVPCQAVAANEFWR